MSKVPKGAKGRMGENHPDAKPTAQKAKQTNQNNKIKEIMSTFSASKPTNVDAQRIVGVLDALIEKIMILQYLDSDLFNSLNDKVKAQEKEELMRHLTESSHLLLTRELELETKLKPLLGGQENIDKTVDEGGVAIDFAGMVTTTAKNLRNLIREVQKAPRDLEILKRLRKNTSLDDYEDFLTYLKGLRLLMLKRLSTSIEEQAAHDRQKEELDRKIQLWERTKATKENELATLKRQKENFSNEKDEELNKLRAQIEEIEMNKKKEMEDLGSESKKYQDGMKKAFDEKETQLMKQLQGLKDELKELRTKNKAEEDGLRGNKTRNEDDLKFLMEGYDATMETNEKQILELNSDITAIEKEIKDYEESLDILKKEEMKEKEIDKKLEKKKELHENEHARIDNIVQSIQNAWKLYKVKAKPKKGKKGGKKDKDKKK